MLDHHILYCNCSSTKLFKAVLQFSSPNHRFVDAATGFEIEYRKGKGPSASAQGQACEFLISQHAQHPALPLQDCPCRGPKGSDPANSIYTHRYPQPQG